MAVANKPALLLKPARKPGRQLELQQPGFRAGFSNRNNAGLFMTAMAHSHSAG